MSLFSARPPGLFVRSLPLAALLGGALTVFACGGGAGESQANAAASGESGAANTAAQSGGDKSAGSTSTASSTKPAGTSTAATGTDTSASGSAGAKAATSGAAGSSASPANAANSSSAAGASASSPSAAAGAASAQMPAAGSSSQPAAAGAGADAMMSSAGSSEPMPSMGCTGGSIQAGRTMGSIQSSGGNRSYIQYIPASYDGKKPVPLVVDLHPFSVGASFQESSSGFRQLADMEGYAYLAPQGLSNMWDSTGDTDEKFIRDLVNKVAADGCIDLRRVYATGCSNGGAFSFLLMCTAEDIFAAVSPMCGTAFFDIETMCMQDRPVSLLLRLGSQDTLNCWEGEGMVLDAPNVMPGTRVECAKTVQKVFTEKYHCKGEIQKKDECELVEDCDEGSAVEICYENTGHVVYQANTARDTYDFLKKYYKH